MRSKFAKVVWTPEDIQTLRPGWSKKKCAKVLAEIEGNIKGDMESRGWETIHFLVDGYYDADGNNISLLHGDL